MSIEDVIKKAQRDRKGIRLRVARRVNESRSDWAYKVIYNDAYDEAMALVKDLLDALKEEQKKKDALTQQPESCIK